MKNLNLTNNEIETIIDSLICQNLELKRYIKKYSLINEPSELIEMQKEIDKNKVIIKKLFR